MPRIRAQKFKIVHCGKLKSPPPPFRKGGKPSWGAHREARCYTELRSRKHQVKGAGSFAPHTPFRLAERRDMVALRRRPRACAVACRRQRRALGLARPRVADILRSAGGGERCADLHAPRGAALCLTRLRVWQKSRGRGGKSPALLVSSILNSTPYYSLNMKNFTSCICGGFRPENGRISKS